MKQVDRWSASKRVAAFLLSLAAVVVTGSTAAAEAQELTASERVQRSTNELLRLVAEGQSYVDEDPERFFVAVEALLSPVVDFSRFARSVMAAHYKTATIEQRERFAELFKWTLVRTYALTLAGFTEGEAVLIPAERPPRNPDRPSVKMEIRMPNGSIYPVVYSMGRTSEAEPWRVRNIIVVGINLGITYRNQFKSAMQDPQYGGDLDKVIESWAGVVAGETEETDNAQKDSAQKDSAQKDAATVKSS